MKILGIIGSPRKNGNTHVLVSRILDGARDKGADTETVPLGNSIYRSATGVMLAGREIICAANMTTWKPCTRR